MRKSHARARVAAQAVSLEVVVAGGCVTVTMSRAKNRNRVTAAMADEMMALFERVEDDDEIGMLAITGPGEIFCGGFEAGVNPNLVESLAVLSKPTVAIINGDAIDEGLELAMAADIRVAIADAHFALTQPSRGAMPTFGGTQRLPRLAGIGNAMRMIVAGAQIDGDEALRIGLITYLAKNRKELGARAGEVAQAILSRGPVAVRMVKDAVRKGYDMTLEQGIRLEEDLYALLQTTADRSEGVRAFIEKRKPLFRGT
ncbi:MAG TPA: enoyl-CoA hydratase/isomerase family protein [Candidatus Binataceae bacterium]|nr:enoyl-CoA hydratase/isomerase family protein [Candidatus Binataceae bacterium]